MIVARRLLTLLALALAVVSLVCVSAAHAASPALSGTHIGCQNWRADQGKEAVVPEQSPANCYLVFHNEYSAPVLSDGDVLGILNVHWNGWGSATAQGTGQLDPFAVGLHQTAGEKVLTAHITASGRTVEGCHEGYYYRTIKVSWGQPIRLFGKPVTSWTFTDPSFGC